MKKALSFLLVVGLLSGCGGAASGSSSASSAMSSSVMLQNTTYKNIEGGGASQEITGLAIAPTGGTNFSMAITDPPNLGGFSSTNTYNGTLLPGSTQNAGSFFIKFQTDPVTICYAYKFDPNTNTLYLAESSTSPDPQTICNAVVDSVTESAYVVQTRG